MKNRVFKVRVVYTIKDEEDPRDRRGPMSDVLTVLDEDDAVARERAVLKVCEDNTGLDPDVQYCEVEHVCRVDLLPLHRPVTTSIR